MGKMDASQISVAIQIVSSVHSEHIGMKVTIIVFYVRRIVDLVIVRLAFLVLGVSMRT